MENFFAVSAPGLEALTRQELRQLGLLPLEAAGGKKQSQTTDESGGVVFQGQVGELYKANLHLRTASRVLVRLGDFYAAAFPELRRKASRLEWDRYLQPGQPVALHATCHHSRLYHSDAVIERVVGAISDRLGKPSPLKKANEDSDQPPQLVIVRLVDDHCTISIDSSGPLLHRRGYRLATAKAPLRETLAAAMLLAGGWEAASPLLDPFCGSGTIAIEAALLACGLPPGRSRRFAFMDWPGFRAERWKDLLEEASARSNNRSPIIQASDRDAGAIRLAQENAQRAGVAGLIEFSNRAVSAITPPAGPGWVITNPPYGLRVSANKDLRNLYAQLGNTLRRHCQSWQVAVLCGDLKLLSQIGLRLDTSFAMVNGGVNVRLGRGRVE